VNIPTVAERGQDVLPALGQVVVGKTTVLEHVLTGMLASGHVLIEDYPGLAKTLILLRRAFVTPDDVKALAVPALAHRLIPRPELWVSKVSPVQVVVEDLLSRVPTPPVEPA
jgi:MoxR-like ATPase